MAAGDPQGWESLGLNDPTKYKASIRLKDSTQTQNIKMRVVTDRATGNYDVYQADLLGDTLIYQYNASNDTTRQVNERLYKEYFTGPNARQNANFNRTIRQRTLELAKNNLSGQTSRNEYQTLQGRTGYQSVSNIQQQNPVNQLTQLTPTSGDEFSGNGSLIGNNLGDFGGADGRGPLDPSAFNPSAQSTANGSANDANNTNNNIEGKVDPNANINTETVAVGGSQETLRYPERTPPGGFNYDYISIKAYEYKPSGVQGVGKKRDPNANKGQGFETVILPMQPSLTESNGVNWGADELNPLQAAFGNLAGDLITKLSGGNFGGAMKSIGSTAQDFANLAKNPEIAAFAKAYFAGQAVGANIVGRSTGMVVNPNLELLFNGPGLRIFNFTFRMVPRTPNESNTIRKIIRAFKRNSAVQRSTSNLFLKTPRIFELKYIYNGNETLSSQHPYLNKFKLCALTSFNVDYTPDNSYMTFLNTGSLTAYNISLSFQEIVPNYADEYPDNEANMGF
jgi:hypothetical protein